MTTEKIFLVRSSEGKWSIVDFPSLKVLEKRALRSYQIFNLGKVDQVKELADHLNDSEKEFCQPKRSSFS